MNNLRTTEQMEADAVKTMGSELGIIFHELKQELMRIYLVWNEYVVIYGERESRIDLLNKSAPLFFKLVQDALWHQTLLHIARITDNPKMGKNNNLSIRLLSNYLESSLKEKNELAIDVSLKDTEFCRNWRNKKIAHKDLEIVTKKNSRLLKSATRLKVKKALSSISKVLNIVELHYFNSTTLYNYSDVDPNGSLSMLYLLDGGLRMNKVKRELKKSGQFDHEHLKLRDI